MKPHKIIGPASNPYMHRWFLFKLGKLPRVYLHKFLRSDDDRALHDHPWWFVSIILRGSYVELTPTGPQVRRTWSVAHRSATFRHRVVLFPNGHGYQPVWTLFITGPVIRPWGFWCPGRLKVISEEPLTIDGTLERFVPWQEFEGCDET